MARFTQADADKYGGHGGAGYFSLKADGDTARVRFLYEDVDDIEGYAVHEVEIDDKKRYVNCLREYNQPIDDCPFCKAKKFQVAKLFIPIYNEDEQKVQYWERGKKFFQKISGICSRYNKTPLVTQTFDIERHGKPGDTQTTYEIYRTEEPADNMRVEDFDVSPVLGSMILDKSADDMEFYLDNGYFPPDEDEVPTRRRESADTRRRTRAEREDDGEDTDERSVRRAGRRTPASGEGVF